MIYLDNSATTRPEQDVLKTFTQAAEQYFGNPSSLHGLGLEAEQLLEKARQSIADLLHVRPTEVIFTSGGTEGNNLAIKGTALEHRNRGKHLITTAMEHPSVAEAFVELENEGFEVTRLPADEKGRVSLSSVKQAIRKDTILVSIIHVNNELGTIQPVEEIGQMLKNYPKITFHVDHVQGAAKLPLDLKQAGIDLCSISAHKFHGVKGAGALYIREGVALSSIFHGGEQEQKYRAGTENVPAIAAMAKAFRLAMEQREQGMEKLQQLRKLLVTELNAVEGVQVNSFDHVSAPHIINFAVPGTKPEVIVQALTKEKIYISTRSACSSKLNEPNTVLLASGLPEKQAESALRISMSYHTTEEEIQTFLTTLKKVVPEFLQVMGAND